MLAIFQIVRTVLVLPFLSRSNNADVIVDISYLIDFWISLLRNTKRMKRNTPEKLISKCIIELNLISQWYCQVYQHKLLKRGGLGLILNWVIPKDLALQWYDEVNMTPNSFAMVPWSNPQPYYSFPVFFNSSLVIFSTAASFWFTVKILRFIVVGVIWIPWYYLRIIFFVLLIIY